MKLLKVLGICIFISPILSCNDSTKPKQQTNFSIHTDSTGISIDWNGVNRIKGGRPLLQGKEVTLNNITAETKNDTSLVYFNYKSENAAIKIDASVNSKKNTVVLSLTSNGLQSSNGSDYVGLFFDTFPSYKEGIASYLFGDWESWTKPIKVIDYKTTQPEKIQFFLFKYDDNAYGAMIPLGGNGYNASLGSQENKFGARSVSYKNNFTANKIPIMAIAFGNNPYETVKSLYETGMTAMGKENGLRKYKTYPEVFESIGWCSWNALGEDVTEKKLMDAIATFSDNNFTLPFMLIDDGWLSINHEKQLTNFQFDQVKFPNGFKSSAEKLKSSHGLKNIGVWHTMNGYWSGVLKNDFHLKSENSLMPYYDKDNVHADSLSGKTYYTPNGHSGKGQQFYDEWYTYLKNQGINFVKVDQQSVIKRVAKGQLNKTNNIPFWNIAENLEANLQGAIAKHFNGSVINCQNMATEAVYNYTTSAIGRNSDDFFPERTAYFSLEVEKGNAAAHVLMNVHNSLWFSNMVWPDFDMFQTHHIDAEYHAISRAISGGPVYLTDTPGKQNFDILNQLTLNNGKILRPDIPALPTEDCLFQINDNKVFKAFSTIGNTGVVGAWNTDDSDEVSGVISPSDINNITGQSFVIYDYFDKSVNILEANESIPITLKRKGYKLYSIIPLEHNIAIIGLLNKYISAKSILSQEINGNSIKVSLVQGGVFGAYLPSQPNQIEINGIKIDKDAWNFSNNLLTLNIESKTVVTILIKL